MDRGDFKQIDQRHVWEAGAQSSLPSLPPDVTARLQPLLDQSFDNCPQFTAAIIQALAPEHEPYYTEVVRAADVGRRQLLERFGWIESYRVELSEVYVPLVRLGYLVYCRLSLRERTLLRSKSRHCNAVVLTSTVESNSRGLIGDIIVGIAVLRIYLGAIRFNERGISFQLVNILCKQW